MQFTNKGHGWMVWQVIDVNGKFTAMLSEPANPAVFADLHHFFREVQDGKEATIRIEQEGTEFRLSVTPASFKNSVDEWPYEDSDSVIAIEQTLFPQGKKTLQDLAINAKKFANQYIEAFGDLLEDKKYGDWKEESLYTDEFLKLSVAAHDEK